jgi:hypothetical protein
MDMREAIDAAVRTARAARRLSVTLTAALVLAGCGSVPISHSVTVSSQEKAASVLMTPTTVAPWSDVSAALAPNFTMSGDAAVAKVLPTTENIQEQVLRAFGVTLAAGLPQSSKTGTTTTSQTSAITDTVANGVDTPGSTSSSNNTTTQTATQGPGVVPTSPSGTPAGGALPAATAPTGALGLDPVLQYRAANYLNQYVQMLNREVTSAAQRNCYVPYLVRLKLAVMTYQPHLAYAIHTRAAFFLNRRGAPDPTKQVVAMIPSAIAPGARTGDAVSVAEVSAAATACNDPTKIPVVVPLLAADDMQVAVRSRAVEAAQQIAGALSLMTHGVGLNLGANSLNQQLQAIQSQDLSSSLTVARQEDNTLYIRIAPNNEAAGQPALVGQTYDIAVLLLVPRVYFPSGKADPDASPTTISLDTYTEFRDGFDGHVLASRSSAALVSQFDTAMEQFLSRDATLQKVWKGSEREVRETAARNLVSTIQTADYKGFETALNCPVMFNPSTGKCPDGVDIYSLRALGTAGYQHVIWTALSTLSADSPFQSAIFETPIPAPIRIGGQTALALDDGKAAATVILRNVQATNISGLSADLTLVPTDPTKGDLEPVDLPAASLKLDPAAQTVTLTFPSPALWGVKAINTSVGKSHLSVALANCNDTRMLCPQLYVAEATPATPMALRLITAAKSDTPADFKVSPDGTDIVAVNGGGTASITLPDLSKQTPAETADISVSGPTIVLATDESKTPLTVSQGAWTAKASGRYLLTFTNLSPGMQFTLSVQGMHAKDKAGSPATVTFHVVGPK